MTSKQNILLQRYKQQTFTDYVISKYQIMNQNHLKDAKFLKLVYALEWYQIPKFKVWDRIQFHPYLTRSDFHLLQQCSANHKYQNLISIAIFGMVSNRLLRMNTAKKVNYMRYIQSRIFRFPLALGIGLGLDVVFNHYILRSIYLNQLQSCGLGKYMILDLDSQMMRKDLKQQYGVDVEVYNDNLDQIQEAVDQRERKRLEMLELEKKNVVIKTGKQEGEEKND